MRIIFVWVGKTKDQRILNLLGHYLGGIGRFADVEVIDAKQEKKHPPKEVRRREGQGLLRHLDLLGARCTRVALDPQGRSYSSIGFSDALSQWLKAGGARVAFVVGGEEGLSLEVLERMDERVSLSSLTFTHELARVVLAEQVYRALNIRKGTRYHR